MNKKNQNISQFEAFRAHVDECNRIALASKKMSTAALVKKVSAQKGRDMSHFDRQMLLIMLDDGSNITMREPEGFQAWFMKQVGGKKINKFSDDQIREMRRMRAEGQTFQDIAAQFGASHIFVRNVCTGKARKDVI